MCVVNPAPRQMRVADPAPSKVSVGHLVYAPSPLLAKRSSIRISSPWKGGGVEDEHVLVDNTLMFRPHTSRGLVIPGP
jgi:hypothetical protein